MKRRAVKKAVFIGIEDSMGGIGDLFIKYLKQHFRSEAVNVIHKACDGGSYSDMTLRAKRAASNDEFGLRLLVWDNDRIEQGIDNPTLEPRYHLLLCKPCIEGELLSLFSPKEVKPATAKDCKNQLGEIRNLEQMERKLKTISDDSFMKNPCFRTIIKAIQTGEYTA